MSSKHLPTFFALPTLAILSSALVLGACDDKQQAAAPKMPPTEVGVVTVAPRTLEISSELPGRTSAFRVAEVRPQVNGIIKKRLFVEGSDVKAGQQLYQIDPALYQATLDSARADLVRAEATLRSVKAKAQRYSDLVSANAVSRQDYDDTMSSRAQNEATVSAAKAAVDTARINLDYTKVFSPISGRIGKSTVTEGALVTANQTAAMATVQQLDPIYVDITQSSAELLQLRREISAGHIKGADAGQAPVTLVMEDGHPYELQGQLQFSDVTVDQTTGAVQLRAVFPNPKLDLLPGLFVRARVDQGSRENALTLPQKAVVRTPDGGASIWVVGADNTVSQRVVKTTQAVGDAWLVTDGIAAGDKVVVEGLQKIKPGMTVNPVAAAAAAAPAGNADPFQAKH